MVGDFRLGDWEVRPSLNQVSGPDGPVHLNPKAMEVLVCLCQAGGEVVSKDELMESVWPETFVSDAVLTSAIWELRKAFGDNARSPVMIETIPRRGYRVLQTVVPTGKKALATPDSAHPSRRTWPVSRLRLLLAAGGIAAAVVLWRWAQAPDAPRPADPARATDPAPIPIALLPFQNNTGLDSLDWLEEGVPDMLSQDLGRSVYLEIVDPDTLPQVPDLVTTGLASDGALSDEKLRELGRHTRVRVFVGGRILGTTEELRLLARIHDKTKSGVTVEQAEGGGADQIFQLTDPLATAIRISLEIEALGEPDFVEGMARTKTDSVVAYERYVAGRRAQERQLYADAITYLQEAIELDPAFAHAYDLLANAYDIVGSDRMALESINRAIAAADRLPELERIRFERRKAQIEGDLEAELSHLRRLVAMRPNEASMHFRLGWFQHIHLKNCERSLSRYRRAVELEPVARPLYYSYLGEAYLACGQPKAAVTSFARHFELSPDDPAAARNLGHALLLVGDHGGARTHLNTALELQPGYSPALANLGDLAAAQGSEREAARRYREFLARAVGPSAELMAHLRLAGLFLELGDPEAAATHIQHALTVDPQSIQGQAASGLLAVHLGDLASAEAEATALEDRLADRSSRREWELAHHLRARIALARGDSAAAAEALTRALANRPIDRAYYLAALAETHASGGRFAEAEATFRKALGVNPRSVRARCGLAVSLARQHRASAARRAYDRCTSMWQGGRTGWLPAWLVEARSAAGTAAVDSDP